MSKLLIDDYPIQVLPKLAEEIGLNEAIFVQQLHYWLNSKSAKVRDDKKWIYNTYEDWSEQFKFWSVSTIRRTITSCEKQNLIIKGNYNRLGIDKTKWYTINYLEIESVSRRVVQNEQTECSKRTDGVVQNEQTITIDYSETKTETTKEKAPSTNKRKKEIYGELENVELEDKEYEKLVELYPDSYKDKIDNLSFYIASKNPKYKNHYAVIRKWASKEEKQQVGVEELWE